MNRRSKSSSTGSSLSRKGAARDASTKQPTSSSASSRGKSTTRRKDAAESRTASTHPSTTTRSRGKDRSNIRVVPRGMNPNEIDRTILSSASSRRQSSNRHKEAVKQSTASTRSPSVERKASRSQGKQKSNVRVLPRGGHPKQVDSGVGGTPKRMKVSVPITATSPASTLTTLSLRSSSSSTISSDARTMKSSVARSTGASTTIRNLMMDDKPKKQELNIFVAQLYNDDHLFELYCNKSNPTDDEKDDFIKASFSDRLHDVLACHTPSENKSAYVKLCSELNVYCDSEKVATNGKIKAAIKELIVPYYEQMR